MVSLLLAAPAAPQQPSDPIEQVLPAVVLIKVDGVPKGTGFLIGPDGYVLTNAHVVCRASQISVQLRTQEEPQPASLEKIDEAGDLALLKIEGKNLPFALLGDSSRVRVQDEIWAIGFPEPGVLGTANPQVLRGEVTAVGQRIEGFPGCGGRIDLEGLIQTNASGVGPGSSGGPMINRRGEVIGIVNGGIRNAQGILLGIAFALPINAALEEFLPQQAVPSSPPEITSLAFPEEFFQGQRVEGRVGFWDVNKDVAFAFVEVVELGGGGTPVSVRQCCPQVFGKLSGEIRFTIEVPVTPTAPEELTLRVTLLDLAGNQSAPVEQRFRARLPKPEIVGIDFPSEIPADGRPNLGTVKFKDPNADVELARFDRVEGPFEPFLINLRERGLFGKSEGIIDFTIRAQEAGRVTVRVTLIDAAGLRSEPQEFSFTAQPVSPPPSPPVLEVTPSELEFHGQEGGSNPAAQTLTIRNSGGQPLTWSAQENIPWLSLNRLGGALQPRQSVDVQVFVNLTGLQAGTRQGEITITAPGAQNSPVVVPVTLIIEPRPSTVTVCPSGCPFTGIQAAIDSAGSGATITIGPGTYEENLEITKSLTLKGAGKDQVILRGGTTGQPVIVVRGARVSIEDLTITEGKAWEIEEGAGILVEERAMVTIENTIISNNDNRGILVQESAEVTLRNSWISDNKAFGIHIRRSSKAYIYDNTIERNGDIGILIIGSSEAEIKRNKVFNTKADPEVIGLGDGIEIGDDSKAMIEGNTISGSARYGILLFIKLAEDPSARLRPSAAEIKNNTIRNSGESGIWVSGSQATIERNIINSNASNGISMAFSAQADISDNRIFDNKHYGVLLALEACGYDFDYFTGKVEGGGNQIYNNAKGNLCPPPRQYSWPPGFGGGA